MSLTELLHSRLEFLILCGAFLLSSDDLLGSSLGACKVKSKYLFDFAGNKFKRAIFAQKLIHLSNFEQEIREQIISKIRLTFATELVVVVSESGRELSSSRRDFRVLIGHVVLILGDFL